jgi:hypothetical protein
VIGAHIENTLAPGKGKYYNNNNNNNNNNAEMKSSLTFTKHTED